ncbi:hypothetical protein K435DRAFT_710690 [Dendrothele bispora CBS 962.96]|uniref:CBF1-interacting co-repressor CIR N-terminal domain-containing protein n=1 Tax=Dendrothele bispora (strain CBS 962.96) TaxID=1314807 RepID=A0A4S8MUL9_DENBC|nr:hypothetical protein K435DRAFT_710690 [Dendrothele bispora CBS 962.96]
MGKLNIAHHKSYHPYRRDNIERVRRDEEEAKLKEAKEEGRMLLADSEARIDLLRDRVGLTAGSNKKSKKRLEEEKELRQLASSTEEATSASTTAKLTTKDGHINFFEDLEQNAITAAVRASKITKASATEETDKGVPLAPSQKDLNPWYSERSGRKAQEMEEEDEATQERRKRDLARKSVHDPLTSITHQLAASSKGSSSSRPKRALPPSASSSQNSQTTARLTRESSERERALALIERKKREAAKASRMGSMTPSTVHGGLDDRESEYGDMYNKQAVEEAHRYKGGYRDRWGHRGHGGRR